MDERADQNFQVSSMEAIGANKGGLDPCWMTMEGGDDDSDVCDSLSIGSSSTFEESANSGVSSSSSDLVEDASSSSSTISNGSLYDLSDLRAHLPIKRGLSKYFEGKSQSFTSLASVRSIEDLPKRVGATPCRKKMKACKSYGGGLDGQKLHSPKATISKKVAKGYSFSSLGRRRPNVGSCRPCAPLQKI